MFCVRVLLLDAANPAGEPGPRRIQAAATDGHRLRSAAEVRARGDHARCPGRAGAGNSRRIGAPSPRAEESQTPREDAERQSCAPGAWDPTKLSDELCLPTIFWGLSPDVLSCDLIARAGAFRPWRRSPLGENFITGQFWTFATQSARSRLSHCNKRRASISRFAVAVSRFGFAVRTVT
jgi:hypothetical protein